MTTVQSQTELRNFLHAELLKVRAKNPRYSLRAFAKKLALPAPSLSEVLNGRRRLTRKMTERIADRLALAPMERAKLLAHFEARLTRRQAQLKRREERSQAQDRILVESDQFHTIAAWYHFGILSLAETRGFRSDPLWIARRLGISAAEATQAIERLVRLRMLERSSKTGELRATGQTYRTSDGIRSLSLRRAHAQSLELARESLENDDLDLRDFTAATVAVDPLRVPEAKRCVRRFLDEMCALLSDGDKREVYKLTVQLFPLTKNSKES